MRHIDQVKIRVRGHARYSVAEREFNNLDDAIWWLQQFKYCENDC